MKDPYNLKEQIKEYFHFSKSEQRGILILLVLIGFFFMLPKVYKTFFFTERVIDFSEFEAEIDAFEAGKKQYRDSVEAAKTYGKSSYNRYSEKERKGGKPLAKPFNFDPNTAGFDELVRLGIREKTAQTLLKYRGKGGKFRKPEDLKKIYGLSDSDFKRLVPYVVIPEKNKTPKAEKTFEEKEKQKENSNWNKAGNPTEKSVEKSETPEKPKAPLVIKINQAEADEWQRLYGIGPAYAKRIVKFRDALGGFYMVDQISEVYGLPDSTFQAIKPFLIVEKQVEKLLGINSADAESLKQHPYISWKQANAIVNYRKHHGPFTSVETIREIGAIDEKTYSRLQPYILIKRESKPEE